MERAEMNQVCRKCGKLNPDKLWGYHVSELCWCGAIKIDGKWQWRPDIIDAQEHLPSTQIDLPLERFIKEASAG